MTVTFGQDLPQERPDADGRAALFVPTAQIKDEILQTLRKGAAAAALRRGGARRVEVVTLARAVR